MNMAPRTAFLTASFFLAAAVCLVASDSSAQDRRVRLSNDLFQRVQTSSTIDTCVIVSGTQAQLNSLARRHGLRIRKQLRGGALVEVPAGSMTGFTRDKRLMSLSSNYRLK